MARWCRMARSSFLIVQGRALKWSPAGYTRAASALDRAMLLTPPATVRAFAAGYRPVLHPSAMHLVARVSESDTRSGPACRFAHAGYR